MNFQTIFSAFQALPNIKKISLVFLISLLCLFTASLIYWFTKTDYATLFTNLENKDARHIIHTLEEKHIAFKLDESGNQIYVAKKEVGKIRLMLMNDSFAIGGKVGYELFDRSDFGMTDFSQKINYLRALQGELERTITSLKEIQSARVHLVIPEKHLFEKSDPPSAGVTLTMTAGEILSNKQVKAIQQLIAASVSQLSVDHITLIDDQGNPLSKNQTDESDGHFQAKQTLEIYLQKKARQMLLAVYPNQPIQVLVDVNLNYDRLEKQSENYVPISDGVITHIKQIKHEKKDKKNDNALDSTIEKSMQYGRVIEKKKNAQGDIKHLSVSVVIPKESKRDMQIRIENIVKNAVGYDPLRGDTISVEALSSQPQPESVLPIISIAPSLTKKAFPSHFVFSGILLLIITVIAFWQYELRRRRYLMQQIKKLLEQAHDKSA